MENITTRDGINEYVNNHKFEFLRMGVLRDYIALEFDCKMDSSNSSTCKSKEFDLNRTIDDVLFLFLFIGNDFLPNIPSIDISDGGLDVLLDVYKESRISWDEPYLTRNGQILDYSRLHAYFSKVQHLLYNAKTNWREHLIGEHNTRDNDSSETEETGLLSRFKQLFFHSIFDFDLEDKSNEAVNKLPSNRRKLRNVPIDRLEKIYYSSKFPSKPTPDDVMAEYFKTIQWVLDYYYRGVDQAGWGHYYGFHYGPMLHNITDFTSQLAMKKKIIESVDKKEKPLPPLVQLLGCLPPSSAHLLPKALRPILLENRNGYFPRSFDIDLNGKRNHWEATILLPFIDVKLLQDEASVLTNGNLAEHGHAWQYKKHERKRFKEDERDDQEFVGDTVCEYNYYSG